MNLLTTCSNSDRRQSYGSQNEEVSQVPQTFKKGRPPSSTRPTPLQNLLEHKPTLHPTIHAPSASPLRPQTPTCHARPRLKSASPPSFTTTATSLHFKNMSSSRDGPSKKPGAVSRFHQDLAKNDRLRKQSFAKEGSFAKSAFATTGLAGHPTSSASAWGITRSQRLVRIGDE